MIREFHLCPLISSPKPKCIICLDKTAVCFFDVYENHQLVELYNFVCDNENCIEYLKLKYC